VSLPSFLCRLRAATATLQRLPSPRGLRDGHRWASLLARSRRRGQLMGRRHVPQFFPFSPPFFSRRMDRLDGDVTHTYTITDPLTPTQRQPRHDPLPLPVIYLVSSPLFSFPLGRRGCRRRRGGVVVPFLPLIGVSFLSSLLELKDESRRLFLLVFARGRVVEDQYTCFPVYSSPLLSGAEWIA